MPQAPPDPPRLWRRDAHKFLEPATVIVCALVYAIFALGICVLLLSGNNPEGRDVVSFWVAGRQIVAHANPYDSATILKIERSVGFPEKTNVLIMRNPPSALCLVVPLGLFGLRAGALIWSLLLLSAMALSVHMLWLMHGRPRNKLHYLCYSFAPALLCVLCGQTALFALLGLTLFLRFHQQPPVRRRPLVVALRAEAPPLSSLRRSAASVGGAPPRLPPACGRGPGARRKLAGRMGARPVGLGAVRPDDALLRDRR